MPTFIPYTLDNLGAAPTSTPGPQAKATLEPTDAPEVEASDAPEHEDESGGGGCFAAPGAPIEGGMAFLIVAVGSAAAIRTVRGKITHL
jgi:hypothetical protein